MWFRILGAAGWNHRGQNKKEKPGLMSKDESDFGQYCTPFQPPPPLLFSLEAKNIPFALLFWEEMKMLLLSLAGREPQGMSSQ